MGPESLRENLYGMLIKTLIPSAYSMDELPLIFMEPVSLIRSHQSIRIFDGPPLEAGVKPFSRYYINRWPETKVQSIRYPYIAATVEGEIDWRVGVTHHCQETKRELSQKKYMVVNVPESTFFFMPPGIAHSDGSDYHWEREQPKLHRSIVFSLLILPAGFMCHYCVSDSTDHYCYPQVFFPCPAASTLAKLLVDELYKENCDDMIARAHLQAILGYARRAFEQEIVLKINHNRSVIYDLVDEQQEIGNDVMFRAVNYIKMNLGEKLTRESIAKHAYVSPRQLDRYFLKYKNTSTMKYLAKTRIEQAERFLLDTGLSVKQIGKLVGYQNPSSFVQVFKRHNGINPSDLRIESDQYS